MQKMRDGIQGRRNNNEQQEMLGEPQNNTIPYKLLGENVSLIKKPNGTKWKLTKLDYYKHEKLRLEKSLEEFKIKKLKGIDIFPKLTVRIIEKYEKKIKDLELKIKLEEMKQP